MITYRDHVEFIMSAYTSDTQTRSETAFVLFTWKFCFAFIHTLSPKKNRRCFVIVLLTFCSRIFTLKNSHVQNRMYSERMASSGRNLYFANYVKPIPRACVCVVRAIVFTFLGVFRVLFVFTWIYISTQHQIQIGSHVFTFAPIKYLKANSKRVHTTQSPFCRMMETNANINIILNEWGRNTWKMLVWFSVCTHIFHMMLRVSATMTNNSCGCTTTGKFK